MKNLILASSLIIIPVILFISSCEKMESNTCNVSNPLEELPWLKETILNYTEYDYLMMADYQGQTVFYHLNCNPLINYVSFVFDCKGNLIGNTNDLEADFSNKKLLWKHTNSECVFTD